MQPTPLARGAEILAQIADKNGGPTKILAQALLDEYEKLGVPIRQIVFREGSHGDYYYTNRAAAALNIPALTSEFCFIDNEEDQKFIDSEEDWQKQRVHSAMRSCIISRRCSIKEATPRLSGAVCFEKRRYLL